MFKHYFNYCTFDFGSFYVQYFKNILIPKHLTLFFIFHCILVLPKYFIWFLLYLVSVLLKSNYFFVNFSFFGSTLSTRISLKVLTKLNSFQSCVRLSLIKTSRCLNNVNLKFPQKDLNLDL